MNNYYIGIDLGTTNTVVTIGEKNPIDGTLKRNTCDIKQYNNLKQEISGPILPSVLYGDGKDIYVGSYAKEMKNKNSKNVIYNSKRSMGTENVFKLNGQLLSAWQVAGEILSACRKSICESYFTDNIDEAIITVPASFDHDKIEDTKKAADSAGFDKNKIHVLHEPTAALIDFVYNATNSSVNPISFEDKKRLFVLDLGGGTCDISVIDTQVINDEIILEEKALNRYEEVGGIDFDYKFAKYLFDFILAENGYYEDELSDEEKNEIFGKLVIIAEQAKENFSNKIKFAERRNETLNNEDLHFVYTFMNLIKGKDISIDVSYSNYVDAVSSLLYKPDHQILTNDELEKFKNIETPIIDTLNKYNIDLDSIDYVYLTGGMSNFPVIKQRIKEILHKEDKDIKQAYDPLKSISNGASIYHYYKVKEKKLCQTCLEEISNLDRESIKELETKEIHKSIRPKQVFSEAIMINLLEGLPRIVIPENKEYPCKDVLKDVLKTTSPSGIKIEVYCGENQYDTKMRKQKVYLTKFDEPVPTGTLLDVEYLIDEDKSLDMNLIVKGNNEQIIKLSRVERMDIKTNSDPTINVVGEFSGLNSSINKLFYYITPEQYIKKLVDIFSEYESAINRTDEFRKNIMEKINQVSNELLMMKINPIEGILYSSKICNHSISTQNDSSTSIITLIKNIIQDIISKDIEGSKHVINHILRKWTWAPQLKIIYLVCSESRQLDLLSECYKSYVNGKFQNTYLKLDIIKALISSSSYNLLSEIFEIVSNLDKNYKMDSEIFDYFDKNFCNNFNDDDIKKMLELSDYVPLSNRYSQNLFARLKRKYENKDAFAFDSKDQDSLLEDLNSSDPRKRRSAYTEARFVKYPRLMEIIYDNLLNKKNILRVPEICEGLISLAIVYEFDSTKINHSREEMIELFNNYELDNEPEYLSTCYAAQIISGLYDKKERYEKLFDDLFDTQLSDKQIIRIIRQVRNYRYRFVENFENYMQKKLCSKDIRELKNAINFYSMLVSEVHSANLDNTIFKILKNSEYVNGNIDELYKTILYYIKKNRNYSNMNIYNKVLFGIKDESNYSEEIRNIANNILKESDIKEGM